MNDDRKTIPRHEPELIAAGTRRFAPGNEDKVATTSLKTLTFDGIEFISRYDKADELEDMRNIVITLSPAQRTNIRSVFCDSQRANYVVKLRNWDSSEAKRTASAIAKAARRLCGGHSGFSVTADNGSFFGDDKRVVHIDADWGPEEEG